MLFQIVVISLLVVVVALQVFYIVRKNKTITVLDDSEIKRHFENQDKLFHEMTNMLLSTVSKNNENIIQYINQQTMLQKQENDILQQKLEAILKNNEQKLNRATDILSAGLSKMQADNEKKLDEMRQTVDEKLHVSLERRLSESFNTINQRLQSVYEGLGEMKTLANGVGDLKKVLTNVKTRGTWGEIQLENLLEQILTHDQFFSQVDIKGNGERVDFAIALPGKDDKTIFLPVDAKFPMEDYQKLVEANENANLVEIEKATKQLEKRIKEEAKAINEKYIFLPNTTDFAVMYLAIEGLYAEVLRCPGLAEQIQRENKVIICGPTTISALLNSLQLGFRTLSIEKRSSEIYNLLGAFKQEFGKFVDLLAKTQKKLSEASNTIEFATKKSKTIERKLKSVASLNAEEELLEFDTDDE